MIFFSLAQARPGGTSPEECAEVETLLDLAFGPGRQAKVSYRFRDGIDPAEDLSVVARAAGGELVGTIRYWPVLIGGRSTPALLLGPVAVLPELKGRGIARTLITETLRMAEAAGHRLVLLVGDLAYYQRFGFRPAPPDVFMPGENPDRLHALELAPGALEGVTGAIKRATGRRPRGRRARLPGQGLPLTGEASTR